MMSDDIHKAINIIFKGEIHISDVIRLNRLEWMVNTPYYCENENCRYRFYWKGGYLKIIHNHISKTVRIKNGDSLIKICDKILNILVPYDHVIFINKILRTLPNGEYYTKPDIIDVRIRAYRRSENIDKII